MHDARKGADGSGDLSTWKLDVHGLMVVPADRARSIMNALGAGGRDRQSSRGIHKACVRTLFNTLQRAPRNVGIVGV